VSSTKLSVTVGQVRIEWREQIRQDTDYLDGQVRDSYAEPYRVGTAVVNAHLWCAVVDYAKWHDRPFCWAVSHGSVLPADGLYAARDNAEAVAALARAGIRTRGSARTLRAAQAAAAASVAALVRHFALGKDAVYGSDEDYDPHQDLATIARWEQ